MLCCFLSLQKVTALLPPPPSALEGLYHRLMAANSGRDGARLRGLSLDVIKYCWENDDDDGPRQLKLQKPNWKAASVNRHSFKAKSLFVPLIWSQSCPPVHPPISLFHRLPLPFFLLFTPSLQRAIRARPINWDHMTSLAHPPLKAAMSPATGWGNRGGRANTQPLITQGVIQTSTH